MSCRGRLNDEEKFAHFGPYFEGENPNYEPFHFMDRFVVWFLGAKYGSFS